VDNGGKRGLTLTIRDIDY